MSLEGLTAILKKEEVVVTQSAKALVDRPKTVDDDYRWHVSTYIPMHKGVAAGRQLDVAAFARRLIQRGRERKPVLGYLTADFGYGKTSAGLYLWQQITEAGFVTVPPFQLNHLADLLDATYGWMRYTLNRTTPHLVAEVERIYHSYTTQSLSQMSAQSGASDEVLAQWVEGGFLTLDFSPEKITRFFREMTALALKAGFNGLLILPDELQQYLEPRIKSGLSDPIAPLFNLVQMIAAQNDLPFGLLLIIPQKELNVINDQRSDFIDRIRRLALDLKAIYGREFPAQLWAKLAKVFDFESVADQIFQPETLEALGQISSRDDLSNGPRTVINTFRAVSRRYLDNELPQAYSPVNLIDDFMNGVIVFDGAKRIQESVGQALASNLAQNNPALIPAIKLAAAFPVEGCSTDLQRRYKLHQAFDELITSGLNELVISVGDRRQGGVTLRGLEVMRDESDWLTKTIREFHRNYYERAANTLERAAHGFVAVLRHDIFKTNEWKLLQEQPANAIQNASLDLEGAFGSVARRFPQRLVHVRVLSEKESVNDVSTLGDVTLEFRLKHHFEVRIDDDGNMLQALTLDKRQGKAHFTLNLLYQGDLPLPHRLEATLGNVVPESKITPLFLLALHDYLENLHVNKLIPKIEAQLVAYEFQPELRRVAVDELLNATVGAQFGVVGARVIEEVVVHLLEACYGDHYHTLMTVANWSNNLRKYKTALRQLKTPFERQGHTPVRGDKDQIASLFGLANTGLDNYLANMAGFLEIVEKFPSKRRQKAGAKGAVLFKQHPLEIEIQEWLSTAEKTIQWKDEPHTALPLVEINSRAAALGYKEAEIKQIIALLESRELVHIQVNHLLQLPQLTISMDDIIDRIEQFQREVQLIQRLFPQTSGLNKLTDKAVFFSDQLKHLPPQPNETIFSLLADLDEQTDWLFETKRGCLATLQRQISAQAGQLPHLSSRHEAFLTTQIVGTIPYLPDLNRIRLELSQTHQDLATNLQNQAQALAQPLTLKEISQMSAEQLSQLIQRTEQREQDLKEANEKLQHFDAKIGPLKQWVEVAEQSATLLNRLQQSGPGANDLLHQFQTAETEIAAAFTQQPAQQMDQAETHHQQLAAIKQQLDQLEAQASANFTKFQRAYQQALTQQLGIAPANLWSPLIYSSLNPAGVHQQVYEAVQRVIQNVLAQLGQETRSLTNSLRNVSVSPALQFLDTAARHHLTSQADELALQLSNLYDPREFEEYAGDLSLIKDFQPPTGGNFYTLLQQIATARQTLQDYQRQFNELQAPLQRLALSPVETELIAGIISLNHSTADLIEIREKFGNLEEPVFWDTLRSLWEKQLVRLHLQYKHPEGKS